MKHEDMKTYQKEYLAETEKHLQRLNDSLLQLEKNVHDRKAIDILFRSVHTLKSSSAAMGYKRISNLAHAMEDVLGKLREDTLQPNHAIVSTLFACVDVLSTMIGRVGKNEEEGITVEPFLDVLTKIQEQSANEEELEQLVATIAPQKKDVVKSVSSINVDIKKLDKLMDLVGELLINKLRFDEIRKKYKELDQPVLQFNRLIKELQFEVMQARMVPVAHVFNKFPRMVRDLADKEGKKVDFQVEGSEIELDRTVLDQIGEPLIHLLRNAVDHGIESETDRKKTGKTEAIIKLLAKREKNNVLISVADNGMGFGEEEVKHAAIKKGIVTQPTLENMSSREIMALPFHPEFSTSTKVTEVSGRGVGLDVVKTKIESLNGVVQLQTKKGEGTTFTLTLPLTLAIVQCFIVGVGKNVYAIPVSNIVKSIDITPEKIKSIEKNEVIIFENIEIPLLRLHDLFSEEQHEDTMEKMTTIIIEKTGERAGLVVDKIIGEQEIIIKPLDKTLKKTRGFSGATILGDGTTALVLDTATLV